MGDYSTILRFAKQEKPFVFATLENTTRKMPWRAVSSCRNSMTTAEEGYDRKGLLHKLQQKDQSYLAERLTTLVFCFNVNSAK